MALNVANISGKIGVNGSLAGNIGARHISGKTIISRNIEYPTYTGELIFTPTAEGLTIPTAHKTLMHDLTIDVIPYTEVSNPSGGVTVNIA